MRVPVRFWHERNTLNIEAGGAPPGHPVKKRRSGSASCRSRGTVPSQRGENKGKTLTYTNIVREMPPVGFWNGKADADPASARAVMHAETQKSVVLLQEGKAGPIIGAAWTGLW